VKVRRKDLQVFWHFGELGKINAVVLDAKQLMHHSLQNNPAPALIRILFQETRNTSCGEKENTLKR